MGFLLVSEYPHGIATTGYYGAGWEYLTAMRMTYSGTLGPAKIDCANRVSLRLMNP